MTEDATLLLSRKEATGDLVDMREKTGELRQDLCLKST